MDKQEFIDDIAKLEPNKLWHYFGEICKIPHTSGNEEQIRTYIINFAKERNLEVEQDEAGNVLIRKIKDNSDKLIALQAHMDMVGEKDYTSTHNFLTDPIKPKIHEQWVTTDGKTNLGADNGIGLAAILALLDSDDANLPNLEALFTNSEEIGMLGSKSLRKNWLQSNILINLDTDKLGFITIGSAGAVNGNFKLALKYLENTEATFSLLITGLTGGHSGVDINKNRGNAIKIAARILKSLDDCIKICFIKSDNAPNAIPINIEIQFASSALYSDLRTRIRAEIANIKNEISSEDSSLKFVFVRDDVINPRVIKPEIQQKVLDILDKFYNGVLAMSDEYPNTVETSNNLAKIVFDDEYMILECLIRSLNNDNKNKLASQLRKLIEDNDGTAVYLSPYSSWIEDGDEIVAKLFSTSTEIEGINASANIIHAGLECGIIKKRYPNMQMASIGPTIEMPHSTHERVNIESVQLFWKWLNSTLSTYKK